MFVSVIVDAEVTQAGECYIYLECMGQSKRICIDGDEQHKVTFDGIPQAAKVSKVRQRRAAIKQEEQVAQLHGGHRNKGSGSVSHRKGDARIRHKYRIENKFTTKQEIRLKREDLMKIRSECTPGECPVFQIDFKAPGTLKTEDQWVLVPLKEWEKKLATSDD